MSSAINRVAAFGRKHDPLDKAAQKLVFGEGKAPGQPEEALEKAEADAAAAAVASEASAKERAAGRGQQFAERRQGNIAAAEAAGATRIASDTDLLGRRTGAKRRSASRVLLGE